MLVSRQTPLYRSNAVSLERSRDPTHVDTDLCGRWAPLLATAIVQTPATLQKPLHHLGTSDYPH